MRIEFHAHEQALAPRLRESIEASLTQAFERFAPRVRRVKVFLWDANGPRGGVDKGIRLIVELVPTGDVLVRELAENAHVAAGRAIARARYAVQRALQRRQTSRRRSTLPRSVKGQRDVADAMAAAPS